MTNFLSIEERNQIEKAKDKLKSELSRLRNKINNFIGIEILTFILTITYLHNQAFLFDVNPTIAWSILSVLILFQVILVMATRVALDNWKFNQRGLELYEMSDEEFERQFNEFCKNSENKKDL
jgi:hypothetical protein